MESVPNGLENTPNETDNYKEPESWTIITALNRVLELAKKSRLSDKFWEQCQNPLQYLKQELDMTDIQVVVLAILVERGESLSWRGIGEYLGCSRLSIMVYSDDIEQLVAKRWLKHKGTHEMNGFFEGVALERGVVTALRHNKPFVPEKLDGLSEQQFVDLLEKHVERNMHDHSLSYYDDEIWMRQLVEANPQLPLCRVLQQFSDIHVQSLLLLAIVDYAQWEGSEQEGLALGTIDDLYPTEYECLDLCYDLLNGEHPLFEQGYIEYKCVDGQVCSEQYVLTRKTKNELLANYTPSRSKCGRVRPDNNRFLRSHQSIKEKKLYFNASEQEQIDRLASLLSTDNLPSIQQRLAEQGMRKGFACLFYGSPGTGKTETVLQIARQTGRDIMQVDIAGMRDKFVGESEKNIKEVFSRYRKLCNDSEVMPILFFNEADGILGKRTTFGSSNPSVEKMDNAMQNIILQEIEDLDGILIATTNLTCNLDNAFERRFLYKVEFHKPNTDVKAHIWKSMLSDISSDEAQQLAAHFDFSGGQIENIARKRTVDYILFGKYASLDEIEGYCRAEQLNGKEHRAIGFTR